MAEQHELRDRGLRLTPQRELVLQAVRILVHATPESILEYVHKTHPGVNLSTIYRNLEALENVGLVEHSHLNHGSASYHAAEELDHFHIVCHVCGDHIDAPKNLAGDFVQTVLGEYEFAIDITHFAISGLCKKCKAL